jgi:hypothetical protein
VCSRLCGAEKGLASAARGERGALQGEKAGSAAFLMEKVAGVGASGAFDTVPMSSKGMCAMYQITGTGEE